MDCLLDWKSVNYVSGINCKLCVRTDTTLKFEATQLESKGILDLTKIKNFRERLLKERASLMQNAYETKLIEKIELDIDDFKDSTKSAKKELDNKKSVFGMDNNGVNYSAPLDEIDTDALEQIIELLFDKI